MSKIKKFFWFNVLLLLGRGERKFVDWTKDFGKQKLHKFINLKLLIIIGFHFLRKVHVKTMKHCLITQTNSEVLILQTISSSI